MRFQGAFELGKKYLWPSRAPKGASVKPSRQAKKSKPFMVYPTKGILNQGEEFQREAPKREVHAFGIGRMALLMAGRKETGKGQPTIFASTPVVPPDPRVS